MKNYIQKIRSRLGHSKFIHPAARILIENTAGEFLFIERSDNGRLGIPAGALEEGETIRDCIIREVQEETGLHLSAVEVIGISTNPVKETVQYPNGDVIQYFTVEFYANKWTGPIEVQDTEEIKKALFKDKSYWTQLPENEQSIIASWTYFQETGKIRLS